MWGMPGIHTPKRLKEWWLRNSLLGDCGTRTVDKRRPRFLLSRSTSMSSLHCCFLSPSSCQVVQSPRRPCCPVKHAILCNYAIERSFVWDHVPIYKFSKQKKNLESNTKKRKSLSKFWWLWIIFQFWIRTLWKTKNGTKSDPSMFSWTFSFVFKLFSLNLDDPHPKGHSEVPDNQLALLKSPSVDRPTRCSKNLLRLEVGTYLWSLCAKTQVCTRLTS